MRPDSFHDQNTQQVQWLLVQIQYISWQYIFRGILTATIVGAFAGLRAKQAAKAKDTNDKCLLCSIDRFKLDSVGGMYKHITDHHNPWSYLKFLTALRLGDPDEFTGLESYVFDKVADGDSTWMPVLKCTSLQLQAKTATGAMRVSKPSMPTPSPQLTSKLEANSTLLKSFDQRIGGIETSISEFSTSTDAQIEELRESITQILLKLQTMAPDPLEIEQVQEQEHLLEQEEVSQST